MVQYFRTIYQSFVVKNFFLSSVFSSSSFSIDLGTAPGNFHKVVPNYNLKKAYKELRDFVLEELEQQRDAGINVNVNRIMPIETP